MKKPLLAAACAVCLSFGAATLANAQVAIRIGPPAPIREAVPPPPHPGWVWQPGYHRWDGARYVWSPGVYAEPPRPHARWVPGHYDHRNGGYFWVEGHWR